MLLDEVFAVGDDEFRAHCFERLRRFREGGGTLLLVSHDRALVGGLCERAVLIEGGSAQRAR